MNKWERYIHETVDDKLVQLAIVHAEFEALHPFLDGNGRLGRMIIPLFLFHAEILQRPVFYMSAYLEARREDYYNRLLAVSRDDDWTGWCDFFLAGLKAQADGNLRKVRSILDLYETKKIRIAEVTHSQYAIRTLDFLFKHPIFPVPYFVKHAGIPSATAKRIVRILREAGTLGVLREARGRRSAVLVFRKLLNLTEGSKTVLRIIGEH
jgi:Fic family protein